MEGAYCGKPIGVLTGVGTFAAVVSLVSYRPGSNNSAVLRAWKVGRREWPQMASSSQIERKR
jgi:hypothetical protein